MKKILSAVMLLVLLVILPLGSYFYLNKGLTYRKKIISELSQKEPFKDTIFDNMGHMLTYKEKCTLLAINSSKEDVKNVYLQFKEAKGFQLVANENANAMKVIISKGDQDEILKKSYVKFDSTTLVRLKQKYADNNFIIIDSLSNIRYKYKDNKEDMIKMVAHITALLPYYDEKKGR